MIFLATSMRRLRRASLGATALEYSLLAALISIAALAAMTRTGTSVNTLFSRVSNATGSVSAPVVTTSYSFATLQGKTWTQTSSSVSGTSRTTTYSAPGGFTAKVIADSSYANVYEQAFGPDGNTYYYQSFSGQYTYKNGVAGYYDPGSYMWNSESYTYAGSTQSADDRSSYDGNANQTTSYHYDYVPQYKATLMSSYSGNVGKPSYLISPLF